MAKKILSLLTLIFLLFLVACSHESKDLQHYIAFIKHRVPKPIEVLPNFKVLTAYKFPQTKNRIDPFKPIDEYSLEVLQFVGTIKLNRILWALIKQPDGKIIRVGVGSYLGTNQVRVASIENDSIQLQDNIKFAGQ